MEIIKDVDGIDGSKQFTIISGIGGNVAFTKTDKFIIAHTWDCSGEGRKFLSSLENLAENEGLELQIPTIISSALHKIVSDNGYKQFKQPIESRMSDGRILEDVIDVWMKVEKGCKEVS